MFGLIRFAWSATEGYRLRPWKSPYIRWRVETYTGLHAESLTMRDFWNMAVREHGQLLRYLRWVVDMQRYTRGRGKK